MKEAREVGFIGLSTGIRVKSSLERPGSGGCVWRIANGLVNVLVSGHSAQQLLNERPGLDGCLGELDGIHRHALVGGSFGISFGGSARE